MNKTRETPKTVDGYIAGFPHSIQISLRKVRATIKRAAPGAKETISYGIPTLKLNGPLIYYAGFKAHISIYPITTTLRKQFKKDLSPYISGKGTAKFSLAQPIPYTLIGRIVKFRMKEKSAKVDGVNKLRKTRG